MKTDAQIKSGIQEELEWDPVVSATDIAAAALHALQWSTLVPDGRVQLKVEKGGAQPAGRGAASAATAPTSGWLLGAGCCNSSDQFNRQQCRECGCTVSSLAVREGETPCAPTCRRSFGTPASKPVIQTTR